MWTVVDPAIVIWCFSPVAGIQWVETLAGLEEIARNLTKCFSPVAGIQWVETNSIYLYHYHSTACFSPVAGIQWVETIKRYHVK